MKYIIPILAGILMFVPLAYAARVYTVPAQETVSVGDQISIDIMLDMQGESVNAVDIGIHYPHLLGVQEISKSGSFITLWVAEPNFTSDSILLSGGIPGGMSKSGKIARVVFTARAVGQGQLGLTSSSTVRLNDGQGTATTLTLDPGIFTIVPRPAHQVPATVSPTPREQVNDTVPPEPFDIVVGHDPNVFQGKYFVSFYTVDGEPKGSEVLSGVNHYEIQEGNRPSAYAKSPYKLSDQTLHTVVRVRAYDAAGNWREAIWPGFFHRLWWWFLRLVHLL